MTIGIPISFSYQSSNVTDPAPTIADLIYGCKAPIFTVGLEVQGEDDWIWEYRSDVDYQVRDWSQTAANNGEYEIGDVVFKNCKLMVVKGKTGSGLTEHKKPKEPEEYSGWDIDNSGVLDPSKWTHRYFRVKNDKQCGWLRKQWRSPSGKRLYYMNWECRNIGGCGTDGCWRWHALDLNASMGGCNDAWYLRQCLKQGYGNKYSAATDIKALIPNWGSTFCAGGCPKEPTVQFRSVIERNGYFYFRTHLNRPLEYHTWTTGTAYKYQMSEVKSPADIKGFVQKRRHNAHAPFDGKNYTATDFITPDEGYAEWSMVATDAFDSIAFGHVICDKIDVTFSDKDGNVLDSLTNYKVDNTVSRTSNREHPATVVLYTKRNPDGTVKLLPAETVVTVKLYGSWIYLGEMVGGETLDAGFTKTNFRNKFKDFSPKEQDQWGNWYYKDGVRVAVHTGTVEYPIVSYDELNRLMLLIGGQKVIINSSDSLENQAPDGRNVFEATMMIARFTSFELSSSEKNKRIGERGTYNFGIEELV